MGDVLSQSSAVQPDGMTAERESAINAVSARLDALPNSATIWLIVVSLSIGAFCEIYDAILTPFLSEGLQKAGIFKVGVTGLFGFSDIASFIAATFAGLWIGTLAFSYSSDRWGRRPALKYSLISYSVFSVVLGLQSSALGVDIWRFLAGIGMGMQIVAIDSFIAEITPKAIRGRAFAVSTAIQFCAVPVGSLLSLYFVPSEPLGISGWRWMAFMPGAFAIVTLFIQRNLPESPRWLARHGDVGTALQTVTDLEARIVASGHRLAPEAARLEAETLGKGEPELSRREWVRRLAMMSGVQFLTAIGYYGFSNWVPALLRAKGADLSHTLGYTAAILVTYPLTPLVFSLFADRFERKALLMTGCLLAAVFGVLFSQQTTPAMWILFGILVTASNNLLAFSIHAYQAEIFPTRIRSRSVGFVYSFNRLSTIFSGYVIAYLLLETGVTGVFTLLDGALVCGAVLVGAFGPRTRGLALEEIA